MDSDKILHVAFVVSGSVRIAYIEKLGPKKYKVRSENNPKWSGGTYDSRVKAEKRLQQIEMFKSMAKSGKSGKPTKN